MIESEAALSIKLIRTTPFALSSVSSGLVARRFSFLRSAWVQCVFNAQCCGLCHKMDHYRPSTQTQYLETSAIPRYSSHYYRMSYLHTRAIFSSGHASP